MEIDLLKIRMTITATERALERLEQALDSNDQRTVGAELYNARRELVYLKQLTEDKSKTEGQQP